MGYSLVLRSSSTIASPHPPLTEIIVWFLAKERKLERLWSIPNAKKVISLFSLIPISNSIEILIVQISVLLQVLIQMY